MCCWLVIYPVSLITERITGARIWIYSCFCLVLRVSFAYLVSFVLWPFVYVMFICILYKIGLRVIYFELVAFLGSVNVSGFVTAFRFVFGSSHSCCKFLRSFRFKYMCLFMFIPVYVILLFSVTVFQSTFA